MKILFAYQASVAPALAGFYFNALELLARLQPAVPPLLAKVNEHMTALNARGRETVDLVMLGEARAIQAGMPELSPPPRPRTPADYHAWAKAITEFVEGVARKEPHEHAAFLLGFALGDLLLSLGLRVLVRDLSSVAPEQPLLNAQHASLREAEQKRTADLALCAANPGLSEETRKMLASWLPVVKTLDNLARPEAVLRYLNEQRPALEATLGG